MCYIQPVMEILFNADLRLPPFVRGKVRDTYELGDRLLIVATDRISAFDVVVPNGITDKGLVLNQLSAFWFDQTRNIIRNHLIEVVEDVSCLDIYLTERERFAYPAYLAGRSMISTFGSRSRALAEATKAAGLPCSFGAPACIRCAVPRQIRAL